MIKGRQINQTKRGAIQLTLHISTDTYVLGSSDVDLADWNSWFQKQPRNFKLEQMPGWWKMSWPKVKAAVNLALHKELEEIVIEDLRVWIRVGDDISIALYSPDVHSHPSPDRQRNPFHPGCLAYHVRFPIDWWNDNIEDLTDEIIWLAKLNS